MTLLATFLLAGVTNGEQQLWYLYNVKMFVDVSIVHVCFTQKAPFMHNAITIITIVMNIRSSDLTMIVPRPDSTCGSGNETMLQMHGQHYNG